MAMASVWALVELSSMPLADSSTLLLLSASVALLPDP